VNIAWLGPSAAVLETYVASFGDPVRRTEDKIKVDSPIVQWADFLVSYGFRHIIPAAVLEIFPRRAINLHISYLPWNRGADPNLWSFLENTPKGVTIHYLDEGLDTGDILVQKVVPYEREDTLRTSYNRLKGALEDLFMSVWPDIRGGSFNATPQPPGGTSHRRADRADYEHLLGNGWDTPIFDLIGKALASKSEG